MAIEELIAENTAALKALTAKMSGAAPAGRPPGRPPGKKAPTAEEVKAIAERVRDEKGGKPVVVALMKKTTGAERIADMDPAKYAQFIAASEVLLNEEDTGGDDDSL